MKPPTKPTPKPSPRAAPSRGADGWTDATTEGAGSREFWRFSAGAILEGVLVGDARTIETRYGSAGVRDVDGEGGERVTVAPKAFCRRLIDLPAGTRIRIEVEGGGSSADDPWRGTLRYRGADVPF